MSFSPPAVGCLLRKGLKKGGVTVTPGPLLPSEGAINEFSQLFYEEHFSPYHNVLKIHMGVLVST